MENFSPRRIRIIETGLVNYTGTVGMTEFVDGVSTTIVPWIEANRIGCAIRIEDADDEGFQISPAAELLRQRGRMADDDGVAAAGSGIIVDGEIKLASVFYTREELEDIADKKGLKGLREIAKGYSIIGRSITEMINAILTAQHGSKDATEVTELEEVVTQIIGESSKEE